MRVWGVCRYLVRHCFNDIARMLSDNSMSSLTIDKMLMYDTWNDLLFPQCIVNKSDAFTGGATLNV